MSKKERIWKFKYISFVKMKSVILVYVVLILLLSQLAVGCQFPFDTEKDRETKRIRGYINLTPHQANEILTKNPKVVLLDVRTSEEYKKEHIKGAVHISLYELEDAIDNKLWPLDKQIIVYDSKGSSSRTAVKALIGSGYLRVSNLAGGIIAWKSAGFPVTR